VAEDTGKKVEAPAAEAKTEEAAPEAAPAEKQ